MPSKRLIVNADDFGLHPAVNRGILKAHVEGVVTSTSLMVRAPAAAEAADQSRDHPRLSVGLHVDIAEWRFDGGSWHPIYQVVDPTDARALEEEVARQWKGFRELMGRSPTHIDSHQHAHRDNPLRSILKRLAEQHRIPLRQVSTDITYCGWFYGQTDRSEPWPEAILPEGFLQVVRDMHAPVIELGCHPSDGSEIDSSYNLERGIECRTLCDPGLRSALEADGVVLCSFADWRQPDAS